MQENKNKFKAWQGDLLEFEEMHGHETNNARHMELKRKKIAKFKGFSLKIYLVGWCISAIIRCVSIVVETIDIWARTMFQ